MAEVTAALVKELRDATGISMMKCKQALDEAGGDIEAARDILRKSGEKDAAKKADRETGEGVIAARIDGPKAAMVQIGCETDFVARGEDMAALTASLLDLAMTQGADTTKAEGEALVQATIQKVGENVRLGEIRVIETDGAIGSYIHSNGKIGVLVSVSGASEEVARDVAMHAAAMNPTVMTPDQVDSSAIEKEREVQAEILKNEGKPAEMVEKILDGKLKKFCDEQALTKQPFVKDSSKTVEQFVAEQGGQITGFVRLAV